MLTLRMNAKSGSPAMWYIANMPKISPLTLSAAVRLAEHHLVKDVLNASR